MANPTVPFSGFILCNPTGKTFLTAQELGSARFFCLPQNVSRSLSPTLKANDVVALMPITNPLDSVGRFVLVELSTTPDAHATGRLSCLTQAEWLLTDNDPDSFYIRVAQEEIVSAWEIRYVVNRKVS